MKKTTLALLALGCAGTLFGQGSLTPPSAPTPTMKTLGELDASVVAVSGLVSQVGSDLNTMLDDVSHTVRRMEDAKRIDVTTLSGDSSYQHIITQPGSYYLTQNMEVTNSGIHIVASGVTLDLNGFQISRASGAEGYGIYIPNGKDSITIKNGSIVGFDHGIQYQGNHCVFEHLVASECADYGFYLVGSALIKECLAHNNLGSGIYAGGGSILDKCKAYGNKGSYGIYIRTGVTLNNCSSISNQSTQDPSYGIYAEYGSSIINCSSVGNSSTNYSSTATQGIGIYAGKGSIVKNCVIRRNFGDGMVVDQNCLITGNTCDINGYNSHLHYNYQTHQYVYLDYGDGAGIHVTGAGNRIENNLVTNTDRGIEVDVDGNFIVRNTASGNTTAFSITGTQTIGPIITATGTITTTNPWANFSF